MREEPEFDSLVYKRPFFGILNAQGNFWTPLAFDSEESARKHIISFWGHDTENRDRCLRTHKIVPVRIRLSALRAKEDI